MVHSSDSKNVALMLGCTNHDNELGEGPLMSAANPVRQYHVLSGLKITTHSNTSNIV